MSVIVLKLNFAQEPRSEGVKDYSNSLNGVKTFERSSSRTVLSQPSICVVENRNQTNKKA